MTMTVGVVAEIGDHRVALTPDAVTLLRSAGLDVTVESGAGARAWYADEAYTAAGATLGTFDEVLDRLDVLATLTRPAARVLDRLRPGTTVVGLLAPDDGYVADLAGRGLTVVSMDRLPRTLSRAQEMDALTAQANVAGYKAAIVAAHAFGRYFPMLVTAAGTARPARVLVLGVGVAGLQAIGTARRLGAVVSAYDIRPETRVEAESVGATFLDLGGGAGQAAGGYARALAEEEQHAERQALAAHIAKHDVVITTAQVPGRRPPLLVDDDAVKAMAPGSVIVDLAAGPFGGNVAGAPPDGTVVTGNGVTVIGAGNLPGTVPTAASAAYGRTVAALVRHLTRDGAVVVDPTDEIQAAVVLAHAGRVGFPAAEPEEPSS